MSKTPTVVRTSRCFLMCLAAAPYLFACDKDEDKSADASRRIEPVHTISFEGLGVDLDKHGKHLAIAAKQSGIIVLETTSPSRPLQIASIPSPLAYKVLLQNETVFAFDEQQGLGSVELRNIDSLQLTPTLSTVELYGFIHDALWIGHSLIFASDATGLSSYDVEHAVENDFYLRGSENPFPESPTQGVTSIDLTTRRLVAGTYQGGLSIYNWQEGMAPTLTAWTATQHPVSDLACNDEHCYVAGLGDGLFIYAMRDGETPELLEQVALEKAIDLVFVDEDLLYIGALGTGSDFAFYVLAPDLAGKMRLRKTLSTKSPVRDFARVDQFVYVLLEDGHMHVYSRESLQ